MKRLLIAVMALAAPAFAQQNPSAAQVLDAYVKALGGADKLHAVTTRVMTGKLENSDDGSNSEVEIRAKAPNLYAMTVKISAGETERTVFSGDAGWREGEAMSSDDVAAARREYDFYRPLRLAELYPTMAAPHKANIGLTSAWVIEAQTPSGEGEKLWFDPETGLLVCREFQRVTLEDGIVAYQEFYEDYRDVEGIKLPFQIRRATADYQLTYRFTSIQLNAPVDAAAFAKP